MAKNQLNGQIKLPIHSYPPKAAPKSIPINLPEFRGEASCAQILTLTVLLQLGEFGWAQTHPVSHLADQSACGRLKEPS